MTVKNLSNISFDELLDCFLLAFENYYVKMPTDRNYYKERWKAAKVDFNFSYGMFEKEKLVGFIIHAIDKRKGTLTAFNTGTGVIPEHRGKRIINSIYKYAFKDLKQNGIKKIKLEVITENKIAVRSYETIGFQICKKFNCFNGTIKTQKTEKVELKEIDSNEIKWEELPNQELYSWDNQKESLLNGNYNYFQVLNNNKAESFFIIKPESGYLAQLDLLNSRNTDCWERLFAAIKQISTTIKLNNVDERLVDKINRLNLIGLENKINQYEMELKITGGNTVYSK
jgi:GNAT superfamily N-acetyltransferase